MGDCCPTPNEHYFSYIMAIAIYFRWYEDDIRFILEQHASLDDYSAILLTLQS